MTTVVLVDDHPIVRQGIRYMLAAHAEFSVVGESERGLEALELVERLRPDLAIVDLMLPDLNGLEVTRRMLRASPTTRVAILSIYDDEPHVIEALQAGAMAYIVKGASAETMLFAMRQALAGQRYLSPPLSDRAVEAYLSQVSAASDEMDDYALLTAREREALE